MKFNKALIFSLAVFVILLSVGMAAAEDNLSDANATGNNTTDMNQTDDDFTDDNSSDENMNVTENIGVVNGTLPPEPDNSTVDISYALSEEPVHKDNHTKNATTIKDKHATGNPLLVLLVAVSAIGVASLRRRK